jgi:DNA-binding transcriptional regulator YdaS (Cro superfamily)
MTLAEWMKANGVTDEELARLVDPPVERSTVTRWRNRTVTPADAHKLEIHRLTNGEVTPNDLMGIEEAA